MMTPRPQPHGFEPPFYAVDLTRLGQKCQRLRAAFARHFARVEVAVSYKTASLPVMLASLHARGALAEVVSAHEWQLARALGVAPEDVILNGPGKGAALLEEALEAGVAVHLDDLQEVEAVVAYARSRGGGPPVGVGLRVALSLPDTQPPGQLSRFGLALEDGRLEQAIARLQEAGVRVHTMHMHLTTRRRLVSHFEAAARQLADAVGLLGEGAAELERLDLGGGFGYAPERLEGVEMPSFEEYAAAMFEALDARVERLEEFEVVLEPGIALFGDVVEAWVPVLSRKQVGGRELVVVDGSVHTIKPTGHGLNLPTRHLDASFQPRRGPRRPVDLVGYTCLEHDRIAQDLPLHPVQLGDVLVIENVGAYTWVFKPPFIRRRPAFLAWDGERWFEAEPAQAFEHVYPHLEEVSR